MRRGGRIKVLYDAAVYIQLAIYCRGASTKGNFVDWQYTHLAEGGREISLNGANAAEAGQV